jgi:Protein of unknown function (DUF3024)
MAFTKAELAKCKRALDAFMERRRPPPHIRDKLDFGYRITEQSIELFEIRPVWNDASRQQEQRFAKATFVRSRDQWHIFWQRADLKWHRYGKHPSAATLVKVLAVIDEDGYGCFFG